MPPSRDESTLHDADGEPAGVAVSPSPGVLLLDLEPAMAGLVDEWLARDGWRVQQDAAHAAGVGLIVIDLPYPRQDGAARVRQLQRAWPGVPVLVLSSTFLPGVPAHGEVARQLGAAAVLASPVARDTLRAVVSKLLRPAGAPR